MVVRWSVGLVEEDLPITGLYQLEVRLHTAKKRSLEVSEGRSRSGPPKSYRFAMTIEVSTHNAMQLQTMVNDRSHGHVLE